MLLRAAFRRCVAEQLALLIPDLRGGVYENRALPVDPKLLPMVSISTPRDTKVSLSRGAPRFNSVFDLQIDLRVADHTDELVAARAERLIEQIELATLANSAIVNLCQQFISVATTMTVDASGATPIASVTIVLQPERYQNYEPATPDVLAAIEVFGPRGEPEHRLAKIAVLPPEEKH